MQLVFWRSILCPLHSSYVRALAERPGWDATVIAETPMTPERLALGWSVPDFGEARVMTVSESPAVLAQCGRDAVHLLEGIRGPSIAWSIFPILCKRSARLGIISEAANESGLRGGLRRIVYTWWSVKHARQTDFILAMGSQGVGWFRQCRFPDSKIYPFCYVTEAIAGRALEPDQPRPTSDVILIFVGQLIARKGGDILFRALASLPDRNWRLIIVGEGRDRSAWERLVAELQISHQVTFTGALPNKKGRALISSADLLILPSRFDGWGAVVNEALMEGVPALCSDRCGARDLLTEAWRGEVFKAGSVENLRGVLVRWIERGKRTPELTQRIKGWSRCIEGESVADYFAAVLRHVYDDAPRPTPPWSRS